MKIIQHTEILISIQEIADAVKRYNSDILRECRASLWKQIEDNFISINPNNFNIPLSFFAKEASPLIQFQTDLTKEELKSFVIDFFRTIASQDGIDALDNSKSGRVIVANYFPTVDETVQKYSEIVSVDFEEIRLILRRLVRTDRTDI